MVSRFMRSAIKVDADLYRVDVVFDDGLGAKMRFFAADILGQVWADVAIRWMMERISSFGSEGNGAFMVVWVVNFRVS